MQFALLIYESPEAFAARNNETTEQYTGAWRAYYKALVEAGITSAAIHWKLFDVNYLPWSFNCRRSQDNPIK